MCAESFRQCVDITSCPMQYAAVRQCHEEHGVEAPQCADQARFYNHCLYAVEFANGAVRRRQVADWANEARTDMDTAGLGMALARADASKDLERYRKDQEEAMRLERRLVLSDIANSGIL